MSEGANASFLAGNGEIVRLIRDFDWSKSPIGPVASWSPALRMMVRFLLANGFPMLLWWGPEYVQIYNDAIADRADLRGVCMLRPLIVDARRYGR